MESQDETLKAEPTKGLIIGWFELVLFLLISVAAGAYLGKVWATQNDHWIHEQLAALQIQASAPSIKIIDPFRIQEEIAEDGFSAEKVSARIKTYAKEQSLAGVITIFPTPVFRASDAHYVSKQDLFPELTE